MGEELELHQVAGQETPLLIATTMICGLLSLFEYDTRILPFAARKLTHLSMGSIILVMMLPETDFQTQATKAVVGTVALCAIALCFVRPFRFGRHRDKGIIVFNLLVLVFLFFDLDFGYLAPAFLADPMGAIVGRCVPSAKWIGDKTVAGSIAVFVCCFFACFRVESLVSRMGMAAGCALLEAAGGELDNLVMNVPVFAYYAAASYARSKGLVYK